MTDVHPASKNTALLTKIWTEGQTGQLELAGARSAADVISAPFERGGPICSQGLILIRRALRGQGTLSFEPMAVGGRGDPRRMAAVLLSEARRLCYDGRVALPPEAVLAWAPQGGFAWGLPLSDEQKQMLLRIDGIRPVSALVAGLCSPPNALKLELAALVALGAVETRSRSFAQVLMPVADLDGLLESLADQPSDVTSIAELRRSGAAKERKRGDTQDEALRQGRRLMEEGRWEEADQVLSAALSERMDNPHLLAALASARAGNTQREPQVRRQEASRLASMATLLDSVDPEVARVRRQLGVHPEKPGRSSAHSARGLWQDPGRLSGARQTPGTGGA